MLKSNFFPIKWMLLSFNIWWVLDLYSPGMEYMNYYSPSSYREDVCQKEWPYSPSSYWFRKSVIEEGVSLCLVNPALSVSLCPMKLIVLTGTNSWHEHPAGHASSVWAVSLLYLPNMICESSSNIICCPRVLRSFLSPQPSLGNTEQNTNQNNPGTQKVAVLLRQ